MIAMKRSEVKISTEKAKNCPPNETMLPRCLFLMLELEMWLATETSDW